MGIAAIWAIAFVGVVTIIGIVVVTVVRMYYEHETDYQRQRREGPY